MVIVITGGPRGDLDKLYQFFMDVFSSLAEEHQEVTAYALFDSKVSERLVVPANTRLLVGSNSLSFPLNVWNKFVLDKRIKALRADLVIRLGEYPIPPGKTPHWLVLTGTEVLAAAGKAAKPEALHRRKLAKAIKSARKVLTFSSASRALLIEKLGSQPKAVDIIPPSIQTLMGKPTPDWKNNFQHSHTAGCEYFVFRVKDLGFNRILFVLKAFSIFKRRQQCSMKLAFAGMNQPMPAAWTEALDHYKYKDELIVLPQMSAQEEAWMIASSYASIMLDGSFLEAELLEYLEGGVPSLVPSNLYLRDIAQDAALYYNPEDINDLAEKLMFIYKDEDMRNRLIKLGQTRAAPFTREQSAASLWEILKNAVREKHLP